MNDEKFEYKSPVAYNLIYLYVIPSSVDHAGLIKVGGATLKSTRPYTDFPPNCQALNDAAHARIKQQTNTAGIKYKLLYTEIAVRWLGAGENRHLGCFADHDVHDVLENTGYMHVKMDGTTAREWYRIDLQTAKNAIKATKECRVALDSSELVGPEEFIFREEQKDAIKKTLKRFEKHFDMLWDAKMRFGKTSTALEVVLRGKYRKTIIITHRPVVATSWREDYKKIFPKSQTPYEFIDKFSAGGSSKAVDEAAKKNLLETYDKSGRHFLYFASIQDLRESNRLDGKYPKNDAVFDTAWDLVIVDEAHEGTQTELGKKVSAALSTKGRTRVLSLSGTPFNILSSYDDDAVFVWDYTMEQKAKQEWAEKHPGERNPYAALPKMNILTFDLTQALGEYAEEELEGKAFNFTEFFRTWTGDVELDGRRLPRDAKIGAFVHAKDVRKFLDLISAPSTTSNYPFATPQQCDFFKHTLWMVPGVAAAKALSAMLDKHPIFGSFGVANVAGEGDGYEDEHYDNALELVREKIRKFPRTITLSCGKLTTGVTVPEWTGVMMIAGSVHTAASSYMQTIFRVQSPWVQGGQMKEDCYVFDFAPDRTLTVLTEAAQLSRRVGKGDDKQGRKALGEFLNFCPVLAMEGGRAKPYDVSAMMRKLKHVFVLKAIRNGFDDPSIYNNAKLMKLGKIDLMKFNGLEKIVGKTKQTEAPNSVDINKHGLTDEEYRKLKEEEQKKKRELTAEEEAALKKHREELKQARNARSILRAISIRMPLLIYGADAPVDEKITIRRFVEMVDEQSWTEFMPKGVTKEKFRDFIEYYDGDVFEAAGLEIRKLAKSAEKLAPGKRVAQIARIFSYFRNPDKETVLTPWRVVNMHLGDTLGGWRFEGEDEPRFVDHGEVTRKVFAPNAKVLEINSKSGLYPLYVAYSIYRSKCGEIAEEDIAEFARVKKWREVLKDNVFVICKTKMAMSITRRTLAGYADTPVNAVYWEDDLGEDDLGEDDLVELLKENPKKFVTKITQGKFWNKEEKEMKFDAVVGNPPYQQMEGGTKNAASNVYQYFVDAAKSIALRFVSLITPARWYIGGKGLDDFRKRMLTDGHMRVLYDFERHEDIFPNVDIAGGVSYYLWDKEHNGECEIVNCVGSDRVKSTRRLDEFETFIRRNESVHIVKRVLSAHGEKAQYLSSRISPRKPFSLPTNYPPHKSGMPCWFIQKIGLSFASKSDVDDSLGLLDGWKLLIPKAPIAGQTDFSKPIGFYYLGNTRIAKPGECCTESWVVAGAFKTKKEAENLRAYLFTKTARFLLLQAVISQDVTRKNFKFVPDLEDYTCVYTDDMLRERWGITEKEWKFIDSRILAVEDINKKESDANFTRNTASQRRSARSSSR